MNSYLLAPTKAVAMIHSGSQFWYVKMENSHFTIGWMNVVHAHNIGKNYLLLFSCAGHLEFNLYIFNENNYEIVYDWTTISPIQYSNAPNDWDSHEAFSHLIGDVMVIAFLPISYRATCHAFRTTIFVKADILEKQLWETFVAAYNLQAGHILILSPDIKLRLHVMVLHLNDHEEIYDWYSIPYDEEPLIWKFTLFMTHIRRKRMTRRIYFVKIPSD
ncbi:uncharacterized protein LOC131303708 [Rhododendron vialii]|uniref:uncharacterized protein LOC131303708 n=1 Tax=Rhododendron vialii TaxID=182163 RepID=UPI00265F1B65|nr:uncharacterized protein LOC131303708 [Rhododendron vialii]